MLPIRMVWSGVSGVGPSSERNRRKKILFLSDEGPMLETLDHTVRIGSTPTFLYFDLYLCLRSTLRLYIMIYIYARNTRQNSTTLYLPPCVNIFAKQKSRLSMFLLLAGFLINMADKKDEKNIYNVSCLEFNGDKSNESF